MEVQHSCKKLIGASQTVDEKVDSLMSILSTAIDKHMPLIKLSRKQNRLHPRPWITKGISRSIRKRNEMYSRLCKTKFFDNMLLCNYKQYKNKLNHIKELAKKNHFKSLLNQSKNAAACSWKIVKQILQFKNQKPKFIDSVTHGNEDITSSQKICEVMINHFTDVGPKLAENIPKSNVSYTTYPVYVIVLCLRRLIPLKFLAFSFYWTPKKQLVSIEYHARLYKCLHT